MFSSRISPLRRPAVWALACLSAFAPRAFAASSSVNFGNVPVGSSSAERSVIVTITRAGTVASVKSTLLGDTNLDYQSAGGSCQRGASYVAGQTCTVNVIFKPSLPGARSGAIVLADASGSPLATTYISGIGQAALPTFAPGTPALIASNIGNLGYAVDARDTIFYGQSGSPAVLYKHLPNGTSTKFVTVPSQFAGISIVGIDGAGNLALIANANQVLRVDPAGNFTVVATIPPQSPTYASVVLQCGAVAPDGTIDLGANGHTFQVAPDGTVTPSGFISDRYGDPYLITHLAVDASGNLALVSFGGVLGPLLTGETDSIAFDASNTLLINNDAASNEPCPVPYKSANCHPGDPHAQPATVVGFSDISVSPNGDVYFTMASGSTTALYRLNRLVPHGVVFASTSLDTSTGAIAITNSGNTPLNLSAFKPAIGGASPDRFAIEKTSCGTSLAPTASCTVMLSFTPSAAFPFTSTATLILTGLPSQTNTVVPLIGYPNQ